jgi:diaminohydroxyphosphoribosylaminopyrimidine deaminase / 5-amino-6-(5-phosphoribosylamino)uracil reductase
MRVMKFESVVPSETGADAAGWEAIASWRGAARRGPVPPLPSAGGTMAELYLPLLRHFAERGSLSIAHLGQSLDGRIATASGASQWITGEDDLLHTHRMRALADAVVVGAGTVAADDPLLTVRRCPGESPVRVVIDAGGRLSGDRRVFDGTQRTLHVVGNDAPRASFHPAERVELPRVDGRIPVGAILSELRRRGLAWIFVEGGGVTVSRFLAENMLDRLQLALAPVLLGSGRPSLILPEIADPARGLRPTMRRIELGRDLLVECIFR